MTLSMFGLLACIGVFGIYLFVESFEDDLRILGVCVAAGVATGKDHHKQAFIYL